MERNSFSAMESWDDLQMKLFHPSGSIDMIVTDGCVDGDVIRRNRQRQFMSARAVYMLTVGHSKCMKRNIDNQPIRVIQSNAPSTDNISILRLTSNYSDNKVELDFIVKHRQSTNTIHSFERTAPSFRHSQTSTHRHMYYARGIDNLHSKLMLPSPWI
jgi:hypothetical protein